MTIGYLPGGYSDSQSDSDLDSDICLESSVTKKERPTPKQSWLNNAVSQQKTKNDFDTDIRFVLDTKDPQVVDNFLTECGVDINYMLSSAHGWSLAMYAASKADYKLLSYLLEKGGKLHSVEQDFSSGFLVLSIIDPRAVNETDILETANVLLTAGDDLNKWQNQHKTPLMLASSYGNVALVNFLLDHGANLNERDTQGWSALLFAADGNNGEVVRLLLEAGADPNCISVDGETASDLAAMQSNSTLQKLIDAISRRHGLNFDLDRPITQEVKKSEMENILLGLGLEEYKETFEKHKVRVEEFLTIREEDMIQMGVEKIGARKRLLEAQFEAHKRTWEKSSMPNVSYSDKQRGLRLSCPDTAGILGNLANHVVFLHASVSYIRLQIRHHGEKLFKAGSDVVPPAHLLSMVNTCRDNAQRLELECRRLSGEMKRGGAEFSSVPLDSLQPKQVASSTLIVGRGFVAAMTVASLVVLSYMNS